MTDHESKQSAGFAILTTQRSGSNWLEDRLANHPEIAMYRAEVFRKTLDAAHSYKSFRAQRPLARVIPPLGKWQYLGWMQAQAAPQTSGFRLMYDQLRRNPSLLASIPRRGIRIVHLIRRNLLATHVSVVAARGTGVYLTRSTHKKAAPVAIDVGGLVHQLERRERSIQRHRQLGRRWGALEIDYESYVEDPSHHDLAVLSFLGLDVVRLETELRRTGARRITDRIQNADEVCDVLADTKWAWMLSE